MIFIFIGFAGFVGAIIRYIISKKMNNSGSGTFPYGTLLVNLIGAFLLGILTGGQASGIYMLILGTGLLGSLTTFSTLNKELHSLQKYPKVWLLYFIVTYLGGLIFALIGYYSTKI